MEETISVLKKLSPEVRRTLIREYDHILLEISPDKDISKLTKKFYNGKVTLNKIFYMIRSGKFWSWWHYNNVVCNCPHVKEGYGFGCLFHHLYLKYNIEDFCKIISCLEEHGTYFSVHNGGFYFYPNSLEVYIREKDPTSYQICIFGPDGEYDQVRLMPEIHQKIESCDIVH